MTEKQSRGVTHKERSAYGRVFEEEFFKQIERRGIPIVKSRAKQDMFDHIDFFIGKTKTPIDVKSNNNSPIVWLEKTNVRGNDGWLLGKAKFIVYQRSDKYYFFPREELLNYCENVCLGNTYKKSDALHRWYTRHKRRDKVMKVNWYDIVKLKGVYVL